MRKVLSIAILTIVLWGCENPEPPEWQMAPQIYDCTEEQTKVVQQEAKFCMDNTTYFSNYCLGTAMMRNCSLNQGRAKRIAPWLLKEAP